ncbi:MAG: hypothetical protein ACRD4S_16995 [Candidatus Acidiferrales bacterium]
MKKKVNARFSQFVSTLDYIEVCRITIAPDGSFTVPSEKDGRIAIVSIASRRALAKFCRELALRLEIGTTKMVTKKR